ncbi:MAG TPA: PKD domain-containing protein, partial [Allocoleopsis sp.]
MIHPVTLDPPPTAAFTASTPACEGGTINFTDNSVSNGSGTINTWAWDFGDPSSGPNNTSNLQNPTHTFAAPGVYTVTLQVQTASGCQSTVYSFQVTIHPKPIPDFALPGVCLPTGFAQFNDLSTIAAGESITGWDWDFGDGSPHSNLQNPTHNYAGTGPYNVTLTTTSSNGCVASITKTLTTIYAEPQAAFTVTPDVCLGNTSSFTDQSSAPGSSVSQWDWDFGDGSPHSNVQNPTHTYAAAGTYTVTLSIISAAGCQTVNNIASHQVTVHTLPTGSVAGNTTVCLNAPSPDVTFTGANGTAPYTFSYTI